MIVNREGIPCIESQGVNLTATAEIFSFSRNTYRANFSGLIVVKIGDAVAAPTTAVPIEFVTTGVAGSNISVLNSAGTAFTTADWPGVGIYLAFYDREINELRLLGV